MKKKENFNLLNLNKFLVFLILLMFQLTPTQNIGIIITGFLFSINLIFILKNKIRIKKSFVLLPFVMIFSIFLMIRTPYIIGAEAQIELFWLLFGVVLFVTLITSGLTVETVLSIVILNGIFGGLLTIISYTTAIYFGGIVAPPYAGTRAIGGFDGPNELASYQLLIASISFGIVVQKKYEISNLFLMSSILISFITIFLTYSRGGLVGLGILILIFYIIYARNKIRKTIYYLIPITLAILIIFQKYGFTLIGNFNQVRQNRSERSYLTEEVMQLFLQKPIFGWGLGSFGEISSVRNTVPHNEFYLFLISGGIISILLFSLFLLCIFSLSIKNKFYPAAFFILIFITQELTFNHLVRGRVSVLFWIIVSLVFINNSLKKYKEENSG